jgi:hypothetical protein
VCVSMFVFVVMYEGPLSVQLGASN